jgi:hypothetical protein
MKTMKDRYTIGFMIGTIAGALADLSSFLLTRVLKIGKIGYEDFAAVLVYSTKAKTIGELIFAHLVQLFFSALLGVLFVFLIKNITSKYLFLKAISFGLFVWLFAFSTAQLYKLPELYKVDLKTALVNYIAAIVFGLVIAIIYRCLSKQEDLL